jgi:hypothetical protein
VRDIVVIEQVPIPDLTLAFDVQGFDGDDDMTQIETFNVFIDGDGDGVIT